ncbi:MAG: hypothetical protein ABID09_04160 [Candidatus Omnitrophota bacterium]
MRRTILFMVGLFFVCSLGCSKGGDAPMAPGEIIKQEAVAPIQGRVQAKVEVPRQIPEPPKIAVILTVKAFFTDEGGAVLEEIEEMVSVGVRRVPSDGSSHEGKAPDNFILEAGSDYQIDVRGGMAFNGFLDPDSIQSRTVYLRGPRTETFYFRKK